ncbi:imm11 family protein [Litchfieldia salsa]|uniref:Immunity MXAN-0049 protein domain-containing protein n=1 Tax=Litchfieldia salsa TaxID=930152 RepID=A0A1H0PVX8_9BACI|nr:DUF1629 domain-containing protein [Litchfieldia salsa]SDP09302.1 hypothetical protein SAMN05216565_101492 [Litchfieldia salsa]
MKIWSLNKQYGKYELLGFLNEKDSDVFQKEFVGITMENNWTPMEVTTYKKGKESDFPAGLLSPPVISEKAAEVLANLIEGQVEVLPLIIDHNRKYYVINVVNVLDCINPELSVSRTFHGRTMEYTKYEFIPEVIGGQDIFKIVFHDTKKILKSAVFVSDIFRQRVIDSGLEGFDFIEVWDSTNMGL